MAFSTFFSFFGLPVSVSVQRVTVSPFISGKDVRVPAQDLPLCMRRTEGRNPGNSARIDPLPGPGGWLLIDGVLDPAIPKWILCIRS
jgi:hypothetical protein